jgi:hypothetical protein
MWEQYKKTFLGVQAMTFGVTAWVYFGLTHWWRPSAFVFLVMQVGGLLGAAWANRIKRRIQSQQGV